VCDFLIDTDKIRDAVVLHKQNVVLDNIQQYFKTSADILSDQVIPESFLHEKKVIPSQYTQAEIDTAMDKCTRSGSVFVV
jgi:hypothetical protein